MVEQEAVNFEVAGSSPAVGAKKTHYDESHSVFSCPALVPTSNRASSPGAWLRFDSEEQDRKVYFYGCDDGTELSSRRSYGLENHLLCLFALKALSTDRLLYNLVRVKRLLFII